MDLSGATVLVTGSNRGIGRAIAEALVREPLKLLLCGVRSPERFTAIDPAGPTPVRPARLDLSSYEAIEASCDELGHDLREIDLLVNNAGLVTGGLLEEQDLAAVYAMFQVNLTGLVHLTRRVLPGMLERRSGKIVNNASVSGYAFFPGASTYAGSKAGVVGFTESLRRELRGTGVSTLQLVTPGVKTGMLAATEAAYGSHLDTSKWEREEPEEWARKAVEAIRDDRPVLGPGGKTALAKLASRGPGFVLDKVSERIFTRDRRG